MDKQKNFFFGPFIRMFYIAIVLAGSSYWGYHKVYKKRIVHRELLITGCARSGTAYISNILQECGLKIGHEKTQKDGVSSWVMCINTKHVPWAVDSRRRLQFTHIFHQVRDPLKVISSVQTEGMPSWKYIIKHIPEIKWEDSQIVKCAKYWYYWNLKAEQQAEWTYRVEALEQVWDEFCSRLERKLDRSKIMHVPRNVNARSHTDISWEDLKLELDPVLYQKIRELAQKYGYS